MNPFESVSSRLGEFDARVRFAGVVAFSIITIVWSEPLFLAGLMGLVLGLYGFGKIPWTRVKRILVSVLPFLTFLFIINLFLFRPKGGTLIGFIYVESLYRSISLVLRFVTLILVAALFVMTTTPVELALAASRLGVPAEFGLALSIAVGYIPILFSQVSGVLEAQRCRAWSAESRNPFKKVKAYVPILLPTFFRSMAVAESLAAALMCRGFGFDMKKRTNMHELSFEARDWAALICIVVFVVSAVLVSSNLTGC